MSGWFLLFLALAPVALVMFIVYVNDKYERESIGRILRVFFISFLTVIPAVILEQMFSIEITDFISLSIMCFGVIAVSEEVVKYLALRLLATNHPTFNEVYDGIVYGVAASLGFAAVENIMYVMMDESGGVGIGIMRAITSIPGHALWGVMIGYHVGLAKFEPNRMRKMPLVMRGLLMAIFWHGLYDFFALGMSLVANQPGLAALFVIGLIAVIIINWIIGIRYMRRAQALSCFKNPRSFARPERIWKYCARCGTANRQVNNFCTRCGTSF